MGVILRGVDVEELRCGGILRSIGWGALWFGLVFCIREGADSMVLLVIVDGKEYELEMTAGAETEWESGGLGALLIEVEGGGERGRVKGGVGTKSVRETPINSHVWAALSLPASKATYAYISKYLSRREHDVTYLSIDSTDRLSVSTPEDIPPRQLCEHLLLASRLIT